MQIVRLVLVLSRPAVPGDAELLHDLLWNHFPSSSNVAHITTTALADRIDVTIFLNSSTENPARRVLALLRTIPKNSTVLGYRIDETTAPPESPEQEQGNHDER